MRCTLVARRCAFFVLTPVRVCLLAAFIHSQNDTLDKLSLNHLQEFGQLGLAYVVELSYAKGHE